MADLSPSEIDALANGLSKLSPGFLPGPVFQQFTRLWVTAIIEVVPLRFNNGTIEVLLFERPKHDPNWGGQLHTPGTVLLATDQKNSFQDAFDRIIEDELGLKTQSEPVYVQTVFHEVNRGSELAQVFWLEVNDSSTGHFYRVENLPKAIVSTQVDFIKAAAKDYSSQNKVK